MRLKSVLLILSFLPVIGGCGVKCLPKFDNDLTRLSSQHTAAAQTELAALATEANAKAKKCSDAKDGVACYRVAAVAAWQAGSAGENLVLPISDAGAAACDALPDKDNSAPRDCSLIRLAVPMAVQDKLAREVIKYQNKRPPGGKLAPTDLAPLKLIFEDLESQFAKVSTIRNRLDGVVVPEEFKVRVDRQWLTIYCNAVKAWSLGGDVEAAPVDDFMAMAQRKKKMAEQLESKGVTTDCGTVPPTEHFDN